LRPPQAKGYITVNAAIYPFLYTSKNFLRRIIMLKGGYTGKILRVNLTTQEISKEEIFVLSLNFQ